MGMPKEIEALCNQVLSAYEQLNGEFEALTYKVCSQLPDGEALYNAIILKSLELCEASVKIDRVRSTSPELEAIVQARYLKDPAEIESNYQKLTQNAQKA